MTLEGVEKEKLLCCSVVTNKHCNALPAKQGPVMVCKWLCTGVRALQHRGSRYPGVYSLPGCGSCYCGVFLLHFLL